MSTKAWQSLMVVVTDPFAREQLAATKAAAVARRCGARVQLFNTFMIPQPVPDVPMDSHKEIIASAIRQRRNQLKAIAARLRLPRSTECIVHWDYPIHEAIVRQVEKTKPDLLISESHRRGRFARFLLANTDWQLMRDCPCPLWFVRSKSLPKQLRVIVAVDPRHTNAKPAELDDRLLRAARTMTAQLGGRVSVVHAYETHADAVPGVLRRPVRPRYPSREQQSLVTTATELVTKIAGKYGVDAQDCMIGEGTPEKVIAKQADRQGANVLIMGAVSRRLLGFPVIGATAERVIDHVDCDVFVVKPAGFNEPSRRGDVPAKRRAEKAGHAGAPA